MLPAAEKVVLVLEGIGDDKIRINSSSLDQPFTILPDQALAEVGYGPQRNSYSVTL